MGRVKLKIKKLETTGSRQVTYSKRRHGILKKARELAILCDIDIILLMFSPTGRPTLYQGERSNIEDVIAKFAQLTPQERAKRKLESLEALKKTFKKLDHDVNIKDFVGSSRQDVEELSNEVSILRDQIAEAHRRLSYWNNPDSINNIEHLQQMEDLIRESLNQTRLHKENLRRHELLSQEFTDQIQSGMSLPLIMDGGQGAQPLLWLPNYGTQQITLPNEPNFLQPGDVECSMATSFPSYPSYFDPGKQIEAGISGQVDSMAQGDGALNELSGTSCTALQLGEQYPYPTCDGSNFPDENRMRLEMEMEMNLPANCVDNQINGKLDFSRSLYDDEHHAWASMQGPCSIPMYQSNPYHHQPNDTTIKYHQ